jgi:hypothetical protein
LEVFQKRKSAIEESNDGFEKVEKVFGIKRDAQGMKKNYYRD